MGFWQKLSGLLGGAKVEDLSTEAPPISPEQAFAELYLARARAHPLVERVEPVAGEPLAFKLYARGADEPWQVFLGNAFRETRDSTPDEKLAAIERLLSIHDVVDDVLSWDEVRPLLVPLVRMTGFGGAMAGAAELLGRPFVPCLRLFVGIDRGDTFSYATKKQVAEWQQSDVSVYACAQAVLQAHVDGEPSGDVACYDDSASYGIWHVTRDDSYESSRLALPGFLESFRGRVPGNPIAIVPHRSLLVISGDGSDAAIARLAQMAEAEFNASPRSISPALYTVAAGHTVVPLHLPREHPQHLAVERGHRILAASCYGDQKGLLDAQYEESQRDVFVATLGLLADKQTREVRSWASWKQGVESLLPVADLVALGADDAKPLFVPWDKLLELLPQGLELEPGHDPPRYLTRTFPSAAQLEALAQHRAI